MVYSLYHDNPWNTRIVTLLSNDPGVGKIRKNKGKCLAIRAVEQHFAPDGLVTRARVAQILYNMEQQPAFRESGCVFCAY